VRRKAGPARKSQPWIGALRLARKAWIKTMSPRRSSRMSRILRILSLSWRTAPSRHEAGPAGTGKTASSGRSASRPADLKAQYLASSNSSYKPWIALRSLPAVESRFPRGPGLAAHLRPQSRSASRVRSFAGQRALSCAREEQARFPLYHGLQVPARAVAITGLAQAMASIMTRESPR